MPATAGSVAVAGSVSHAEGTSQFVLAERLSGHDTFLTGVLQLGDRRIAVRIITLDDVTVLRPVAPGTFTDLKATWAGLLHLPHGVRRRAIPADLTAAAHRHQRVLDHLDDAELRYALTFLEEATTNDIRQVRIAAIVAALPPVAERAARRAGGTARPRNERPDGC
ncbi:hypothetical protein GCM10022225_61400 [Plantactinospora mayteni]|uniref:Uncharacterized protein n=1 Tax=Plantactinospora mayteni TaxID=566021 RepID=A0ABQ4EZM1_9ACTN|nr:hypothetical protein [Plantactinospora mayteni]GIH00118.1 hypothetical protein Pma05_66900 [Plantactinospora mayteni]